MEVQRTLLAEVPDEQRVILSPGILSPFVSSTLELREEAQRAAAVCLLHGPSLHPSRNPFFGASLQFQVMCDCGIEPDYT